METEQVKTTKALRLDLGCGDKPVDGFVGVDRKLGSEVYPLAGVAEGSVDEIRASHVLEHFGHNEASEVLLHWVSKLKPGGTIKIAVPNFQWIAEKYLAGENVNVQGYTMGGQTDGNDYHKSIFDAEALSEMMADVGLQRIRAWTPDHQDCSALPVSLNLQGDRPFTEVQDKTFDKRDIVGVLSCPRYGYNLHHRCTFNALGRLHIPSSQGQGAYWHQILTHLIENAIHEDEKPKYVLTMDYDTLFEEDDVRTLWKILETFEDLDAVCAMQSKRGSDTPLLGITDKDGKPLDQVPFSTFERIATPVSTGHFGLTLLRTSVLENLKRPWFLAVPDPNGSWHEGRKDADIYFWNNWTQQGHTVAVANRVVVGHLQDIVMWPGKDLKPVYQGTGEYIDKGKPKEVVR